MILYYLRFGFGEAKTENTRSGQQGHNTKIPEAGNAENTTSKIITHIEKWSIDTTGFNTNPKGGNRLWRMQGAWFREIDVLK